MTSPEPLCPFSISRIHTDCGIFRIHGFWSHQNTGNRITIFSDVFILSTDGWEEIALTFSNRNMLEQLISLAEHHLMSVNRANVREKR